MALQIASLNSGSNGNCYYVGTENQAVFIDAGISCRETEKRMKRLGLDIHKVKAIFISHEHSDHISGVTTLSKKYQLPVYITPITLQYSNIKIEQHLSKNFKPFETTIIGELCITAFPKSHDGKDPHSFIVNGSNVIIGVFTDIGKVCNNLKKYFKICHAVFLEANYDSEMLMNGNYPTHLKNRISGELGHLSNADALELFINHRSKHLNYLILSHLSQQNNTPDLVKNIFDPYNHLAKIIIASRYEESQIFTIFKKERNDSSEILARQKKSVQLSIFE